MAWRFCLLAPLPGLWLALTAGTQVTAAPDLLLGVTLGLDAAGRLLLAMTAVLWCIAGLAARPMADTPNVALFAGFWCVTLTGNLGVFLARDVATFYVAFAAVSLASWFLIVHDRSDKALRAGRVYIVIALVGEVALLLGLVLGAFAAESMIIADVRAALGTPALALLVIGFGIKAGLVPLHVWLPLAHPAAPVPASAVLSGSIVKAGLFGMILFLPDGMFGAALMGLGLAGAFGAAVWGLTQENPKAVLAYSTVSQMGLMILLLGAGGDAREALPYFAMHHGFAKGALFLLVGVMLVATEPRQRLTCLVVATAVAASVAGLPLTGGALAKTAVKDGLSQATTLAMSLGSVSASVILVWFLLRLRQLEPTHDATGWWVRLLLPVAAGVLSQAGPWLLRTAWTGKDPGYLLRPPTLLDALWPLALALPVALALARWRLPDRQPGDLLLLLGPWRLAPVETRRCPMPEVDGARTLRSLRETTDWVEHLLTRWRTSGALVPLLVLLFLALLT